MPYELQCAGTFMQLINGHMHCRKSAPLKGLDFLVYSFITKSMALTGLSILNTYPYYEL